MQPKEDRLVTEAALDPLVSDALEPEDDGEFVFLNRLGKVAVRIDLEGKHPYRVYEIRRIT